ncbi:unnamed protein product, partial [Adineta steineri]
MPRRGHLSNPQEKEVIDLEWSKVIPSQGRGLEEKFQGTLWEYGKPKIPIQTTPDSSYTPSPDIPHQDSSSNEELRGFSSTEPLYLIPKTEVNQLHRHTRAYLKSLVQIPIIYQIPRSRFSQRRTQPYGDGETLTSIIYDLIIDTIYDICQPIIVISHSETSVDLVDFQGDLTFFNFPETQARGFGAPKPPETNPPLESTPYPQLNFTFVGSMVANPWWLTINALVIPVPQNPLPKHPEKLLPKFDLDDDILPKNHIDKFMLSMNIMNVQ